MSKTTSQEAVPTHYSITIDALPMMLSVLAGPEAGRNSIMLLSNPGIGKTDSVADFAKTMKADLHTVVASTLDRMDVAGMPISVLSETLGHVTRFAPMELMAKLCRHKNPNGGAVVLYFNELMDAPESVYPVLMRLFNERAIGDVVLRDNVILIADGNPPETNVSGRSLPFALKRRFLWLVVRPSLDVWERWAFANGVDARVIAFLSNSSFRQRFSEYNPRDRHSLTYPCPASWTKLGRALDRIQGSIRGEENLSAAFASFVGVPAATDFIGFMAFESKMPNVKMILDDPENAKLPDEPSLLGLITAGVLNLLREDPAKVEKAIALAARLIDTKGGKNLYPEYGAFLIRGMASIPSIQRKLTTKSMARFMDIFKKCPELFKALTTADSFKSIAA